MSELKSLGLGLTSLLAPERCAACRAPFEARGWGWSDALCPRCEQRVERLDAACRACGAGQGPHTVEELGCAACKGRGRGRVASTTALLRYRGVARALVARVKYGGRDPQAATLGRDLARRWLAREPRAASADGLVVVPVPLHLWRRWRRGFNQAEEVARGVAGELGRPIALALRRRRATRALHEVPREAREQVMAGAFAPSRLARAVCGRPVVLVDDIRTSGATLREAAAVLHALGADRIDALVVAR